MSSTYIIWDTVQDCKAITWDTCHKIYVLMDDLQVEKMIEYGYDPLIYAKDSSTEELMAYLEDWYANSCGLRFISAVSTVKGDPNEGFTDLVAQGEDWHNDY